MMVSPRSIPWVRVSTSLGALAVALLRPTEAAAQIKEPGNHPHYSVELEPHLVLQWSYTNWNDDGIGLGGRVSIPVIDNGPVKTINNNFAVGFGLDWAHFDDDCWGYYRPGPGRWNCSGDHFWIPVVAQWNFFFTPVVSAFAEMGFAVQHGSENVPCDVNFNANYCGDVTFTRVRPDFGVGPRFHLGDSFAITLRLSIPYLSIGGSFFL